MYFVNVTIRSPPFSLQESEEATFCIIFFIFLRYGMAYLEARILRNQAPALFNSSSRLLILSMQVFTRV